MGRTSRIGAFRSVDAFGKTMEDVKIKTTTGGFLTLLSLSLILSLTIYEFIDYRRVFWSPSIVVDKSRGEKLIVNLNISFPRVPCYLLSVDIMDISGEHQNDVNHDMSKTRLSSTGTIVAAPTGKELTGDLERIAARKAAGYCGSCYGGTPPTEGENAGCCNTCEEVREAYVRRGWSFVNPDAVEQCVSEGWTERIAEQSGEGCRLAGKVKVNKVIGNFHLSPGRSFQSNAMHVHDLVPYLQGGNKHDFGHQIHSFSFGSEDEEEFASGGWGGGEGVEQTKKGLGIVNPLDGLDGHTEESNYMFQYFLKVVSSKFDFLDGRVLNTHQYSVTQYERDLSAAAKGKDELGHQTSHGYSGVPGLFFNYEISALKVHHVETRQSFAHFLTSTCAIVGGVLTCAGVLDSFLYAGRRRLKVAGGGGSGKEGMGFASKSGRLL